MSRAGIRACLLTAALPALLGALLLPAAVAVPGASASASPAGSPAKTASTVGSPANTASTAGSPATTPSPSDSVSPSATPSASESAPATTSPRPTGTPKSPRGGLVVRGPHLYDPAAHRNFTQPSYVTVSQVRNLVNQVVHVSWRNVTPSSLPTYNPDTTDYPVMVAECTGLHPTKWSQCFGANNGGVAGTTTPYGPMNTSYATTAHNGTGEADIQLLTAQEDEQLGCNVGHPCSLVVVPSQGGNIFTDPVRCSDHSQDTGQSDIGSIAFTNSYGECSWRDKIIVPLRFAPTPTDCPVRTPDFSVIGSPMIARAMSSWQSALCSASEPLSIQYDSAQNEPLARTDFLAGMDDVALTTRPGSGTGSRPYTYAPVAISAISIAYWIDNPRTGKPIGHLRLDARLVAKLITQSYNFENEGCGHGVVTKTKGVGCDNAVDGDPTSLFADPEFRRLNPHVAAVGDGFQVPTVLSGESDMTYELTRWLAASPAAKSFVDGSFDPWGEHVNTDYLHMQLPTSSLNSMDPYPPLAHRYVPTYPLSQVAEYQVDNWYPATEWQPDTSGNYEDLPPEVPGDRALFAILDEGDAAAFDLPVAAIQNADGKYVTPTSASMSAALTEMRTSGNHITADIKENAKDPAAYPLTMVIYAMVPTGGLKAKQAAAIAQWLDFVAGQGQHAGNEPGQLPSGYLPLTAAMRAQTLKAADDVLSQTGDAAKHRASVKPSATASPTTSASPTAGGAASHSPGVSFSDVSDPLSAGVTRFAVPVLLGIGVALAVAGGLALVAGQGGAAAVARLRRFRLGGLGLRRFRLGRFRSGKESKQ